MPVAIISVHFFEVSAQVIPVLFFALLFDLGVSSRRNPASPGLGSTVFLVAVIVFVMAAGEIASLAVLVNDSPTSGALSIVAMALSTSLALVSARVLFELSRATEGTIPWLERHYLKAGVVFGGVIGVGASIALLQSQ